MNSPREDHRITRDNRFLESLLGSLPGMAYRCANDPDWTMEFLSVGCHDLTGYFPEELIENRVASYGDLIAPEDRDSVWESIQLALEAKRYYQIHYRIRRRDGETRWLSEKGRGIWGEDGNLEALEGFISDVTSEATAAQATKEAEERYRFLFDSMTQGVIAQAPDGRIISANRTAQRILGLYRNPDPSRGEEELTYESLVFTDAKGAARISPFDTVLAESAPASGILAGVFNPMRQEQRWLILDLFPRFDPESGALSEVFSTFRDITDLRNAESALQESEERYRRLVELSPDLIALHRDGIIEYINPAGARILGVDSPEQILGRALEEIVPPNAGKDDFKLLHGDNQDGELPQFREMTLLRLSGEEFEAEVASVPAGEDDDLLFQIIARDITERKRSEQDLVRINRSLKILTEISQALVYSVGEIELCRRVCGCIIGTGGYIAVSIGFCEGSGSSESIRQVASCAREDSNREDGRGWRQDDFICGVTRKAIRERLVCTSSFDDEHPDSHWPPDLLARGFRAVCALPLIYDEECFGALTIVSADFASFGENEVALLAEVGADVSFGIAMAHSREEKERAIVALQESELRFRRIFEDHSAVMILVDPLSGEIVDANPASASFYGYSVEDLRRRHIYDISCAEQRESRDAMLSAVSGKRERFALRHRLADGSVRDVNLHSAPIRIQERTLLFSIVTDVTDQLKAERALSASEERYRAFIEQSSEGIWRFEFHRPMPMSLPPKDAIDWFYRETTLSECNDAMARMYGYRTAREMIGIAPEQILPRDVYPNEDTLEAMFLAGCQLNGVVSHELHRDGSLRWFHNNVLGIVEDGLLLRIWGTQLDITDLKQAENALRESEARYRLLFQSSPIGVFHYNPKLEVTGSNDHFAAILGDCSAFLASLRRTEEPDQAILAALEAPFAGTNGSYEGPVTFPKTKSTHISVKTSPIFTDSGGILGAIGMIEDVSERVHAESALRRSEGRFRSLVESMDDIVFTLDREERFTGIYGRWTERLAVDATQLIGQASTVMFAQGEGSFHKDAARKALGGNPAIYEWRIRVNEASLHIQMSLSPIFSEGGEVAGLVGIGRDVTRLKEYERELRTHTSRLEALYDGAMALGSTLDLEVIYQKLYDIIRAVTPCDGMIISSFSVEDNLIRCERAWHEGISLDVSALQPLPLQREGEGTQSTAIRTGRSILIGDYDQRARRTARNVFLNHDGGSFEDVPGDAPVTRSAIIVPIKFEFDVVGVVQIFSYERNAYNDEQLRFVESLTTHAAAAHRNGMLYRRAQEEIAERARAEKLQTALWKIAQTASIARDESEIYPSIHSIVTEILPAENFYIALAGPESNVLRFPYVCEDGKITSSSRKTQAGLTDYVIRQRRSLHWRKDQPLNPELDGIQVIGKPAAVWMGAPLLIDAGGVGAIAVQDYFNPAVFSEKDRRALEYVADETARSISHIRARNALAESEAKYRSLIENSEDGIYLLVENHFEVVNPRFLEMLKVTLEEVLDPSFSMYQLVAPGSREMIAERSRMIETGQTPPPRYEFTALRLDGVEIEVEVSVAQIMYKGKHATQGIVRDVTGRRQLENQIRQKQKLEAIGGLAGGVAHDFNNLLTAIIGTAELMRTQVSQNPALDSEVEQILAAATRGSNLTKQLLAFSRFTPQKAKPMNLTGSVESIQRMLRRLIGDNISLKTELAPSLPAVLADPSQIELAVMNLVTNARDAMPSGGAITIRTARATFDEAFTAHHPDARQGEYCLLAVIDQGVGMSPQVLERAMEPFFTTKPVGQGTGLGLSTVHGIVRQSDGYLSIHSEEGRGTEIDIYLPVTDSPIAEVIDIARPSAGELKGKETILVADDEEAVRAVTVKILQLQGYKVIDASDGEEALKLGAEYTEPIDLLVSDMVMPKMGGIELADKLRSLKPAIKVLLMSGYSPRAYPDEEMQPQHQHAFIQKPFRAAELAAKVREVLDIP